MSHVLADRVSSRPKGWSKACLDKIARLRTLLANGVDVKNYVAKKLTQKGAAKVETREHGLY